MGNVLYFILLYVINEDEIKFMVNMCFESIEEYYKRIGDIM